MSQQQNQSITCTSTTGSPLPHSEEAICCSEKKKILVYEEEWNALHKKNEAYKHHIHQSEYKILEGKNQLLKERLERANLEKIIEGFKLKESRQNEAAKSGDAIQKLFEEHNQQNAHQIDLKIEAEMQKCERQLRAHYEQSLKDSQQQYEDLMQKQMDEFAAEGKLHQQQLYEQVHAVIRENVEAERRTAAQIGSSSCSSAHQPPKRARLERSPDEELMQTNQAAAVAENKRKIEEIIQGFKSVAMKDDFLELRNQCSEMVTKKELDRLANTSLQIMAMKLVELEQFKNNTLEKMVTREEIGHAMNNNLEKTNEGLAELRSEMLAKTACVPSREDLGHLALAMKTDLDLLRTECLEKMATALEDGLDKAMQKMATKEELEQLQAQLLEKVKTVGDVCGRLHGQIKTFQQDIMTLRNELNTTTALVLLQKKK